MKKKQSGRLTKQHKKNQGVIGIFGCRAIFYKRQRSKEKIR